MELGININHKISNTIPSLILDTIKGTISAIDCNIKNNK